MLFNNVWLILVLNRLLYSPLFLCGDKLNFMWVWKHPNRGLERLLQKCNKTVFLWIQESSWNNLISVPPVTYHGFWDELVAVYSFLYIQILVWTQLKAESLLKTKARGAAGKALMHVNQTTKPGRLNVCSSYIFLETIIVISSSNEQFFGMKWLYSNKYCLLNFWELKLNMNY